MRRKSLTLQNTIITFPLVNDTGTAGVQKWRYGTGDQIGWSSPAIGPDGTVYFGSLACPRPGGGNGTGYLGNGT